MLLTIPPHLVLIPVDNGECRLLSQVLGQRPVVEEGLGALPSADFPDAGHVQPRPLPVLLGWLPAQAAQVRVQRVEAAVDPGVGPDLLELAAALHEGQTVCSTAHLRIQTSRPYFRCSFI